MNERITVIVGSRNPVKVNAAEATFRTAFPGAEVLVQGVDARSEVHDQPMSTAETLLGAQNRVKHIKSTHPGADYYVAFEGGAGEFSHGAAAFAYVVVASKTTTSVGRTADLPLPKRFFEALQQGQELGDVMDAHFKTHNIKQQGGAIGSMTNHHETRQSTYQQALMLALAPFLHSALY